MLSYKLENSDPAIHTVFMAGELREDSTLPELPAPGSTLLVNLDLMTGLNSVGTRLWCRWIGDASTKYKEMIIEEAPMLFVKAFGQIQGALTKHCKVNSIKIPYYSESLGENKNVTARLGEHYTFDGPTSLPQVKDSLGQLMEVDVIEEAYFSFLKVI
ncbi:MAG: hypothetical protein IT287_07660 [Bdellovibrionaceae bacterium]|nr:hypothetical protein [Pseudobdellovibrionaceae bacterium]